ncbi:MAG TPA: hypothetical protein PLD59_07400 [Tepidisphaeraceae bacterium]|nr:hypothetical protein [Tepidisphaeraceae bacterium]
MGVRIVGAGNVASSPDYLKDYGKRLTGAILFWDGPPGGTLLQIKGSNTGSIENMTFVGATPQKYQFSISNSATDPGARFLRFKSSTFANVSEIYISVENFFGVEVPDWLDRIDNAATGRLSIYSELFDRFAIFDVTGGVSGSGLWRTINVTPVQAKGTFTNNEHLIVSFVASGGTPQKFQILTDPYDPDDGQLRIVTNGSGDVTQILVSNLNAANFNVSAWLDSLPGPDMRVTLTGMTSDAVQVVAKVTGVTASTNLRTISVTEIYKTGSFSALDPVVLTCSRQDPIRDRAGALVL